MAYSVTHNYLTRNVDEYKHLDFTVDFYRRVSGGILVCSQAPVIRILKYPQTKLKCTRSAPFITFLGFMLLQVKMFCVLKKPVPTFPQIQKPPLTLKVYWQVVTEPPNVQLLLKMNVLIWTEFSVSLFNIKVNKLEKLYTK